MTCFALSFATALLLAGAAVAQEQAFPQVQNDSEGRVTITYGAGARGGVVGGGVPTIVGVDPGTGRPQIEYRMGQQAQAPGAPVGDFTMLSTAAQGA
jgi:hypothetical protein